MGRPTNFQLALKALVRQEVQREVILPLLRFGEKKPAQSIPSAKVKALPLVKGKKGA